MPRLRFCFLLLPCLLAACASVREDTAVDAVTYVVVRHAEKIHDAGDDPALSETGRKRAQALAETLQSAPLQAAYATAYRRTRMTAQPAAERHGLAVTTYDARQPAADFATWLRREHRAGTVLVVGHSNTAADIAAALCACTTAPLGEDEFDRRFTIRIAADGRATLHEDRY